MAVQGNLNYGVIRTYGWLGPFPVGSQLGVRPATADAFEDLLIPPFYPNTDWVGYPSYTPIPKRIAALPPPVMPSWEDLEWWPDFDLLESTDLLSPAVNLFKSCRSYDHNSKRMLKSRFPSVNASSITHVYNEYRSYPVAHYVLQSGISAICSRFGVSTIQDLRDLNSHLRGPKTPLTVGFYGDIPVSRHNPQPYAKLFHVAIVLHQSKERAPRYVLRCDKDLCLHIEWLKFRMERDSIIAAHPHLVQQRDDEHVRMRPALPAHGHPSRLWPEVFCFGKKPSDAFAGKFVSDDSAALCQLCLQEGKFHKISRITGRIANMHRHLMSAHGIAIAKPKKK